MAKRFEFSYPYASYMDVSLMRETRTKKELQAEYKRLAAEANRRLAALGKYKWMRDSKAYENNIGKYSRGISRMTKADLAKQMREAAIFLASQSSTIAGQRRHRDRLLYTFTEQWGLEFLNRRNIVEFARYLEAWREKYGAAYYSMVDVEATYRAAKAEKLDMTRVKTDFDEFLSDAKKSKHYEAAYREASERYSSDDFLR